MRSSPILDLQFDSENNLWIRTLLEGIVIFDGVSWQDVEVSSKMGDDRVLAMFIDSENRKWFASNQILANLKEDAWRIDNLPLQFDENEDELSTLLVDPEKEMVWIGTWQGNVWTRGPEGRWTRHQLIFDMPVGSIHVFYQDLSGQLWAGTDVGLFSYEASEWKYQGSPWDEHEYGEILAIAMDQKGQLWVGGSQGVGMMSKGGEDWIYFEEQSPDIDGVSCIKMARDGTMWFVGLGGIVQFIPADQQIGVSSASIIK
jgi:ligand-binding sensor domain-containing protein